MSSSSRSIAAARSRRAGESQPPVSGGRPGTSIASHSAFVQQQMPPPPSNNVRIAKAPMQQQQQQQQAQGGLPFSKLSVSDAIGLITLRLGRIEQFVMESENDDVHSQSKGNIPENSKIVDNSVLTTIINRLDSLEKREGSNAAVASSVANLEKELKETKDLLSHLLFKFELFSKETNEKFGDFEGAIAEIEKNMESHQFVELNDTMSATLVAEESSVLVQDDNISLTAFDLKNPTIDLKNLIKQEFSASESANK